MLIDCYDGAHNYLSDWIVQRIFKNVKHEHDRFLKNLEILNFIEVKFGEKWKNVGVI